MQDSRLSRFGKSIVQNKSNFVLLQEISPQDYSNDQPIKNASTLFIDENGKQVQMPLIKKSSQKKMKEENVQFKMESLKLDESKYMGKDNISQGLAKSKNYQPKKSKIKEKFINSEYVTDRPVLDPIKEVSSSDFYERKKIEKMSRILSINRPKGFQKRKERFQEIDFIGGDLYEIEDIIGDIGKIIEKNNKKNLMMPIKSGGTDSLKNNKWLNNHFGGGPLGKLDEMLRNYKSIPDQQPILPIMEDFYRQSSKSEQSLNGKSGDKWGKELKNKYKESMSKPSSFSFPSRTKPSDQSKLSVIVVKWSQMPMIGSKWQSSVYLKMHSYPQQEEYRRVVFKACELNVKSYSIFNYPEAGIFYPELNEQKQNDKNFASQPIPHKLMSQQEYAKAWQQKLVNGSALSEQQKQLLMQFDIEWYRTFIQFCYHSGLEDLLQKQYDVGTYINVMNSLERYENITGEVILGNQMKYLREYFDQVYTYTSKQIVIGMVRINNDDKMQIEQIYEKFSNILGEQNGKDIQFCIWPLKEDNSSFVVLLQLCGSRDSEAISLKKQQKSIQINIKDYKSKIEILEHNYYGKVGKNQQQEQPQPGILKKNKLIIKYSQENDWRVHMKLQNAESNSHRKDKKINISEQLLFGVLYNVQLI